MTEVEFDRAIEKLPRMSSAIRLAAFRVVVKGESSAAVAREIGRTRQQINQAAKRVMVEAGYETVTLTLKPKGREKFHNWCKENARFVESKS